MSDFDRNVAARGGFADRAAAVDAGLRAYMLRVYNYMAAAVALTGVVAYATFNAAVVTDASGKITALTPFGQTIFSGPLSIVLLLGTGAGVLYQLPHQPLQSPRRWRCSAYAALLGVTSSIFSPTPDIDHARCSSSRRRRSGVEPVGYTAARPVGDGLVPDQGCSASSSRAWSTCS